MRKLSSLFFFILLAALLLYGQFVYSTNRTVPQPTRQDLSDSLEKSILWMLANRAHVLSQQNDMLWWMIKKSSHLTGDQRLAAIYEEFQKATNPLSPWQHLYNPNSFAPIRPDELGSLPDYNLLFLYGLTCDKELGQLEVIERQLKEDFCWDNHLISPACLTHQLMGFRFMQDRACGDQGMVSSMVAAIQRKIVAQLRWDPRVVDVYIQRVLMLVESGYPGEIKPSWIQKVLDAQLEDGGWGGFDPIILLGKSKALGFTAKGLGIASPRSNLHATAQGILLMSLLLEEEKGNI